MQELDFEKLRERLLADRQVLVWTGARPRAAQSVDPKTLPGIVVDDAAAERTGFDGVSQVLGPFVGAGYRHDDNMDKGRQSIRFRLEVPEAGRYKVRVAYTANENRATNVPVVVSQMGVEKMVRLNQRQRPADGPFATVGTFDFAAGEALIEISNTGTDGFVVADAVQLLPVDQRP